MTDLLFKTVVVTILLSLSVWPGTGHTQECPSIEAARKAISKRNVKVIGVTPGPVPGLCQVHIKHQDISRVLYIDKAGEHLIAGNIYRISNGTNLTGEAVADLNRFTEEELERLEKLVAFTIGTGKKTLFIATDPQCGYCTMAEEILESMAESGQIKVKFLMFPLAFHKGAREECISLVCDKKGLEGLRENYISENQCREGISKVDETIAFLKKKGISGTPAYIFDDGLTISGVMTREALVKKLGLAAGSESEQESSK
ncbi:MAG TPA: DsbC family protein [Thermodesulfobacteriaceae bacterium]|nr:DsbC family protein [Thermodesulfobacteriaceae bacterium]